MDRYSRYIGAFRNSNAGLREQERKLRELSGAHAGIAPGNHGFRFLFSNLGAAIIRFLPAFLLIVLIVAGLQLTGCSTMGFKSFSVEGPDQQQPPAKLEGLSIIYTTNRPLSRELSFAIEKTLRERYQVFDVRPLSGNAFPLARNSFLIRVDSQSHAPIPGQVMLGINFLTFAVIPATWSENHTMLVTLVAPDGREKDFRYFWSERGYSWLPMILFGPKYFMNISIETDLYQEERIEILSRIMARFLNEASPFILMHIGGHNQ